MREIKFRVWSKTLNAMYWLDVVWGNCWGMGGGWLVCVPWGEERTYHPPNRVSVDPAESEFMQFTGLHDRNGKEIYEGDVVKFDGSVYEVKYREQFFAFVLEDEEGRLLMCDVVCCTIHDDGGTTLNTHIEVIGNIYENPELLEGNR